MKLLSNNNYYDPFFDEFFAPTLRDRKTEGLMRTDVKDEGENYLMEVELPGVDKNNISVEYENGYVTVDVKETSEQKEEKSKHNYIVRERRSINMSRSFYVGEIDEKDIKAEFKDGILRLNIPKEDKEKVESKKRILID